MSTEQRTSSNTPFKPLWLLIAIIVLVGILLLPTPADLPEAGHRALAILGFAVVLWMTEAVSYPVSAALLIGLISLIIGLGPSIEDSSQIMESKKALKWALEGFSSSAVALVAGALFLAAAMQVTDLHRRIALLILSRVGSKTNRIVIGAILVSIVLAFFVPSATARAGAVVPILLGMVTAFGLSKNSRLAALLVITAVQAISIWNVGIKTAAAQNMVALDLISKTMNVSFTWSEWFMYAAPWSILMSIILYFVMMKTLPPETHEITNGQEMVRQQLQEMGPLKNTEIRLIIVSLLLLFFWSTEGTLHDLDTSTTTLTAIAILLTPGIGVFSWKEAEEKIPWGTIIMFAVGISMGGILLKTQAAAWLANGFFNLFGLNAMPILSVIAIITLFNILIHLGFASATSLASVLIPIVIAIVGALEHEGLNTPGMVLLQQFVISFGFILPINAPQNMLAYGTGSFTVKQFVRTGIPLTIIAYLMILLFSSTYWKWVGLI